MKHHILLPLIFICLLISCRENKLDGKVRKIQCQYIAWACDCAHWATLEDRKKYERGNPDTFAAHCIYMEPADTSLDIPFGSIEDVVEFTGQFYKDKGFPKGYHSQEMPDKARVFRYTSCRVRRGGKR